MLLLFLFVFLALVLALGCRRLDIRADSCPEWMPGCVFAHRGLHGEGVAENTLAAFASAVDHGCAIELDVRGTRDGVPMIVHDDCLKRLTGHNIRLSRKSYAEVSTLSLLASDERIPTLSEAIAFIGGRVPVLVDIKSYDFSGAFEHAVTSTLAAYPGHCAVQSFNPMAVRAVRKACPRLCVGLLLLGLSTPALRLFRVCKDNLLCAICRPAFITYRYSDVLPREFSTFRENAHIVMGFGMTERDMDEPDWRQRVDCAIIDRA